MVSSQPGPFSTHDIRPSEAALPRLTQTYAEQFPDLAVPATPEIPEGTAIAKLNRDLALELGLNDTALLGPDGLAWLTGTDPDSAPVALAYSGHQFGQLSPVLGDGRAHLVGELKASAPGRGQASHAAIADIHLKGSGRTPFSRPGSDGKAPLSAAWREFVIGEALHGLGIPTSRALAVLETGERIRRRAPEPEPAGIVARVARSHIRVGTFQYAQMNLDREQRERLVTVCLDRHFPHIDRNSATEAPALTLLRLVAHRQADLVAQWMSVGFVHGVLNSDNVAISGESIDFGPCAFIDTFEHAAVFSSIDQQGRYAYRNQPAITQWNLARFAETLIDLIDPENPDAAVDAATAILGEYEERYHSAWTSAFAAKLGLWVPEGAAFEADGADGADGAGDADAGETDDTRARVRAFAETTLDLLEQDRMDFTVFFRTLTDDASALRTLTRMPATADTWLAQLRELRTATGTSEESAAALMRAVNPVYVPRNNHLEAALREVEKGNTEPIERLLTALHDPFTRKPGCDDLETPPPGANFFRSFCGT